MAQPGWLPDPTGRSQYRYWDGAAWTENVSRDGQTSSDALTSPPPPPAETPPVPRVPALSAAGGITDASTAVKTLVFAGVAALVVGSFLPWVKASAGVFTATRNGTDGDGILTLILAGLVALLFTLVRSRATAAGLVMIFGGLAAIITFYDLANISKKANDLASTSSGVSASVGVGLIVAAAASVAVVLGGILGYREARFT
jgi:hypothetical protein